MDPVTIFRSFSAAEAQLARSRLDAAGFHADVIHETASLMTEGYSMATGGIRVQVPASEAEEALALLNSTESTE
jgi:hypothetical protein